MQGNECHATVHWLSKKRFKQLVKGTKRVSQFLRCAKKKGERSKHLFREQLGQRTRFSKKPRYLKLQKEEELWLAAGERNPSNMVKKQERVNERRRETDRGQQPEKEHKWKDRKNLDLRQLAGGPGAGPKGEGPHLSN